jgi:hypothetical protein
MVENVSASCQGTDDAVVARASSKLSTLACTRRFPAPVALLFSELWPCAWQLQCPSRPHFFTKFSPIQPASQKVRSRAQTRSRRFKESTDYISCLLRGQLVCRVVFRSTQAPPILCKLNCSSFVQEQMAVELLFPCYALPSPPLRDLLLFCCRQ